MTLPAMEGVKLARTGEERLAAARTWAMAVKPVRSVTVPSGLLTVMVKVKSSPAYSCKSTSAGMAVSVTGPPVTSGSTSASCSGRG